MTAGLLVVVPYLVSVYRTSMRVATAQQTAELIPTSRGGVGVLASVVFFLHVPYHQAQVNKVWEANSPG